MTDSNTSHRNPNPDKSVGWPVGGLKKALFVFGGLALALAAIQTGDALIQASAENDARNNIAAMRRESAWLVGQKLTSPRPIGVFDTSILALSTRFRPEESSGAHASFVPLIFGVEAPLMLRKGLAREWAISAGPDKDPAFALYGVEAIYRHEEAHARSESLGLAPSPPAYWPAAVSKALLPILSRAVPAGHGDWRSAWLFEIREEAFADAYSILSTARRGSAAMAQEALDIHASRIFYPKETRYATALAAAGSNHVADPASLLAGQLNAASVGRLGAEGLDELSGLVADASMAHALARSAPALGFFSKAGEEWWMGIAGAAGLPKAEAEAAWEQWREDSLSATPKAAFGAQAWSVGGEAFSVQAIQAPSSTIHWRFDGLGGQALTKNRFEPGSDGPLHAGAATLSKDATGKYVFPLAVDAKKAKEAWAGAVWSHWVLASAIGADPSLLAIKIAHISENPFARDKTEALLASFSAVILPSRASQGFNVEKKLASRRSERARILPVVVAKPRS